jgi:glycosyltransferase involved in cell wall biosynthesis
MKVVATVHGPLASLRYFWSAQNWRVRYVYDQLDLRLLRYFDHVMMVSDSMRGTVERFGVDRDKLTWVKNAIDSRFFRKGQVESGYFRDRLKIPTGAKVVGAVGRLNAEKDYPNLIGAAKILLAERRDLYFTIAGGGPLEERLRCQVASMGLADRVLFLGHFNDVRQVYDLMDVYALSSTREGLPNTILEAMAMEVPIVATDVDGVGEAVVDGREALLVPPRNSGLLADRIRSLLDDPALASQLCRAAREKVEREFSFASRMRHVESIYRKVMRVANGAPSCEAAWPRAVADAREAAVEPLLICP